MTTEIIYLGHDNTIDLLLKTGGVAQDLSTVTKITATFGTTTITSENKTTGAITWDQAAYATGEIRLSLGGQIIPPGGYEVPIVVYDPSNTSGVVWGTFLAMVKDEVEA